MKSIIEVALLSSLAALPFLAQGAVAQDASSTVPTDDSGRLFNSMNFQADLSSVANLIQSEARAEDKSPPSEVFDVTTYGAKGNNSTDDTAAVQAAINAAGQGNIVFFPRGNYCINGGIVVTNANVRLTGGAGTYGTGANLRSCNNADVPTVTLQGSNDVLYRIAIAGPAGPNIASPTVLITSAASNFSIVFSNIANGYYGLNVAANDGIVAFSNFGNAYGTAIIYATGSNHYIRDKVDQPFPVSTPGPHTLPNPIPAWVPSHPYGAGNIVASGAWYLQCRVGGVSGASNPVLSTYGTDIHDGAAIWRMLGPSKYYGMQLDQPVTATQITQGDFTGPYTAGIALTNSVPGVKPQNIKISATNFGTTMPYNILASGGTSLYLSEGNTFANCIQVGCALVAFTGDWVGQSYVVGNTFAQGSIGIDNLSGQGLTVVGNRFQGLNIAGFHAGAGTSLFDFSHNDCATVSGGPTGGPCVVLDDGVSNYIIEDNLGN